MLVSEPAHPHLNLLACRDLPTQGVDRLLCLPSDELPDLVIVLCEVSSTSHPEWFPRFLLPHYSARPVWLTCWMPDSCQRVLLGLAASLLLFLLWTVRLHLTLVVWNSSGLFKPTNKIKMPILLWDKMRFLTDYDPGEESRGPGVGYVLPNI